MIRNLTKKLLFEQNQEIHDDLEKKTLKNQKFRLRTPSTSFKTWFFKGETIFNQNARIQKEEREAEA